MEQSELRNLEAKCIQEAPPPCVTACPVHVDIRAIAAAIQKGDMTGALKALKRTIPFPGIIGTICDQPCQSFCNRNNIGGAIQVAALEKACVNLGPTSPDSFLIPPSRGKKVAIIGGGLSGLTAAYDLAKKGYPVTILEARDQLGGSIRNYPEEKLPRSLIEADLAVIATLKIQINLKQEIKTEPQLDALLTEFEAIYLATGSNSRETWGLAADEAHIKIDPVTYATSREGVFAGGQLRYGPGHYSPILSIADGRRSAISIDRFLQKASLTASRFNEGPHKSELYTNTKGIEPSPAAPMENPEAGYNREEAVREAKRCLLCECMECVHSCIFLKHFEGYPRKYVRQIYNNESIVIGNRTANKMINSCTLCGLCEQLCPNNLAMQEVCLQARQRMVQRGVMPPSAHEFALLDMEFSQSGKFALTKHAPGFSSSSYVFFPGCQLSASSPDKVRIVYDYLLDNLAKDTGLILDCCGAPAYWAGQEKLFKKTIENLHSKWQEMGKPKIITACSTCYRLFRDNLPDIPVISMWQFLDQLPLPALPFELKSVTLAVSDPCTTRHEPEIQAAVRRLLNKRGVKVEELALSGKETECCGFGGLVQNANPELAKAIAQNRSQESDLDYLAYCAMCRDSLSKVGKRTIHLLDLIFADNPEPIAKDWRAPGWSERRENRTRLKEQLLKEKWHQESTLMESSRKIKLKINPEMAELLEKRRILIEDIQQVIDFAEKTDTQFCDLKTGHFTASFKPRSVTFWVEYSRLSEGYEVHNAYSHRMEVVQS